MTKKWVDNSDYFGPDRRQRRNLKLLGERRNDDLSGDLPPLGILLRRLRVHLLGLRTAEERNRALQLLSGAIQEASRLGYRQCSDALQAADRALRQPGANAAAIADRQIVEAINFAAGQR